MPVVTDEALVKNYDVVFRKFNGTGDAAFMGSGIGDSCKSCDMTIVIQQGVHFDTALDWRSQTQGKSERQSLMVVESRLNSLDLKRSSVLPGYELALNMGHYIMPQASAQESQNPAFLC